MIPSDVTGQRFGRLTAVSRSDTDDHGNARWVCKCACGSLTTVALRNLRSRGTRSCGCLRREENDRAKAKQVPN